MLVKYTKFHFAREEKFLPETGYPAAGPHKQQHEALTRQVLDVQKKYNAGATATLSVDVMQFLKNWLISHIQGSDQSYRPHLNAKGIH
jgi:hemerythrin